ncbi:MAG: molybdate ABC transporter substrate-binding protein [Burkholderiaceae bacterium]|jgi:molybdate transport system substrate-binding protein|nr:molybdate ABC transporter substrate-binding protein [Burkholderiaceae bacterium]
MPSRWLALIAALAWPWYASADQVRVAVAANFSAPAKALATLLEQSTEHTALLSFGATGMLYAQIKHGAPFDVLLAADAERPARLEAEGEAAPGTRLTYAIGQLALWSARPGLVDDQGEVLKGGGFDKLAIANPKTAPYGAAAMQTLERLGLRAALQPKLVTGESIGQTYHFIATGNAELGFIALSQVEPGRGSLWVVPEHLHAPIRQDAVTLKRARDNPAAKAWMALLRSPRGQDLIRSHGFMTK